MAISKGVKIAGWERTLLQAAIVWLLSNLPLIFIAVFQWWSKLKSPGSESLIYFFGENLRTGEAFLYVAAFVAPFFWTLMTYNEASERMPVLMVPFLLAILSLAGSAFLFAVYRASPQGALAQMPFVGPVLYFVGLIVWIKSMHDDRALPHLVDPTMSSRARVTKISGGLEG